MPNRSVTSSRIIAIAGPKGGIGRSTCAVAFGRALAARERRVLIIDDNDYAGSVANLTDQPPLTPCPPVALSPVQTAQKNLKVVAISTITDSVEKLYNAYHSLPYDDIIIDLKAGFASSTLDLFIHADLPILISDSSPISLQLTTLWLRRLVVRFIETTPDYSSILKYFYPIKDTWDFFKIYQDLPASIHPLLTSALSRLRIAFLLNGRRENSDDIQGLAVCHAWGMLLGLDIPFLCSIVFDDRRWFFTRQLSDVSLFLREDPLVREFDALYREHLNADIFLNWPCLPIINPSTQPRQFLRAKTPAEARIAYRNLWEGYRRENGLVSNVLSKESVLQTVTLIELAYRNADNEENFSRTLSPISFSTAEATSVSRSYSNSFAVVTNYDPSDCDSDAGEWLKSQREKADMSLSQLALRTRIPLKIVEKLERLELDDIPAMRLQAYLFEISKVLDLSIEVIRKKFGLKSSD